MLLSVVIYVRLTIFKPIYQQFLFHNASRIYRSENLSISFWQNPKTLLAANENVNFLASLNSKETNKFWKLAKILLVQKCSSPIQDFTLSVLKHFVFLISFNMWQPNLLCRVTLKKFPAFENKLFGNRYINI